MSTIFTKYQDNYELIDKYLSETEKAIDVIIPVINTNDLWMVNLFSFYREVPINRLLIGDGGCTDDTIDIVKNFPRVEILDQRKFDSQGFAIKDLILNVKTEHFIYLHADVYLPPGWYDKVYKYKDDYEWFETFRQLTIQFEMPSINEFYQERPYSGTQFGNTKFMQNSISDVIEDDFLQRNEDIILMELIKGNGGRYGKIKDTFHYHQISNKKGETEPNLKSISIIRESDPNWEKRIFNMQYKGIIKYLEPKQYLIENIFLSLIFLSKNGHFNWKEIKTFIQDNNPLWDNKITRYSFFKYQIKQTIKGFIKVLEEKTQLASLIIRTKSKYKKS